MVVGLEDSVLQALPPALADKLRKTDEQLDVDAALAMYLTLDFSDARYSQLRRFLPDLLPPLSQICSRREELAPPLEPFTDIVGANIGYMVSDPATLLRTHLAYYIQRGCKQRHFVIKVGTDNFSLVDFSKKLQFFQQVALYPILDEALPGAGAPPPLSSLAAAARAQAQLLEVIQKTTAAHERQSKATAAAQEAATQAAATQARHAAEVDRAEEVAASVLFAAAGEIYTAEGAAAGLTTAEVEASLELWINQPRDEFDELLGSPESDVPATLQPNPIPAIPGFQSEQSDVVVEMLADTLAMHNSPHHLIPVAFGACKETEGNLRRLFQALDARLPNTLTIDGETVTLEYHFAGDAAAAAEIFGWAGVSCLSNCIWCLGRHGKYGLDVVGQMPCVRTLQSMLDDAAKAAERRGCAAALPVLPILSATPAVVVHPRVPECEDVVGSNHVNGVAFKPLCRLFKPEDYLTEILHATINTFSTHFAHTEALADAMRPEEKGWLRAVVEGLGYKRPIQGWDCTASFQLIKRREEWLAGMAAHPQHEQLLRRFALLEALLTTGRAAQPSEEAIAQFLVDATELGNLLLETWGKGSGRPHYSFKFYDHALICHAHGQLVTHGSLLTHSTWFLEHANKWWKSFLLHHTSCGGGVNEAAANRESQALRRYALLTHPEVRQQVVDIVQRVRPIYRCGGCGGPKLTGHTAICPAAKLLKLNRAYQRSAGGGVDGGVAQTPA